MTKKKEIKKEQGTPSESFGKISSTADLKSFLNTIHDKLTEDVGSPIYALTAMNHIMNLQSVYDILDSETKELARNIWLRLKASGLQLRNPPILFGAEDGLVSEGVGDGLGR